VQADGFFFFGNRTGGREKETKIIVFASSTVFTACNRYAGWKGGARNSRGEEHVPPPPFFRTRYIYPRSRVRRKTFRAPRVPRLNTFRSLIARNFIRRYINYARRPRCRRVRRRRGLWREISPGTRKLHAGIETVCVCVCVCGEDTLVSFWTYKRTVPGTKENRQEVARVARERGTRKKFKRRLYHLFPA